MRLEEASIHVLWGMYDVEEGAAPQHGRVPRVEALARGCALHTRMAPKDEIVTTLRRARPDMTVLEPTRLCPLHVAYHNLMVHQRPRFHGSEKFYAVEIRDVDTRTIRLRACIVKLLDVKAEETHVDSVNTLKEQNTLLSVWKVARNLHAVLGC